MKKLTTFFTVALLITAITINFSGCATLFSGTKDEVELSSEPAGAEVYVNGQKRGKTPISLKLKKGKEYNIEFKKNGFEDKLFQISYSLGAGWLILDILGGLIPVIVDAMTNAWNGLDYDAYNAVLDKSKTGSDEK